MDLALAVLVERVAVDVQAGPWAKPSGPSIGGASRTQAEIWSSVLTGLAARSASARALASALACSSSASVGGRVARAAAVVTTSSSAERATAALGRASGRASRAARGDAGREHGRNLRPRHSGLRSVTELGPECIVEVRARRSWGRGYSASSAASSAAMSGGRGVSNRRVSPVIGCTKPSTAACRAWRVKPISVRAALTGAAGAPAP
jgi:hypothetical protein